MLIKTDAVVEDGKYLNILLAKGILNPACDNLRLVGEISSRHVTLRLKGLFERVHVALNPGEGGAGDASQSEPNVGSLDTRSLSGIECVLDELSNDSGRAEIVKGSDAGRSETRAGSWTEAQIGGSVGHGD